MIKVNKNLIQFSGLFLLLGTILLFTIQKFSPLVGHATYYCQSFINTHMIPIPEYLSILPVAFFFLILTISFIKFLVLTFKVQYLQYLLKGKIIIEKNVNRLIKSLGLESKTIIIKSNEKFAFCLGFKNPKIYLSTGLITQLSLEEVKAVLRHEQYHLENHDTFTMIIALTAHSLFPFFPVLGDLIKKYRIEREIAADKFAIAKIGDSSNLISALKMLLSFPTVEKIGLAAIAEQGTLEPRIYSLLNKPYAHKQLRLRNILITVFSALLVGSIMVIPIHAKELHHEEYDVMMVCTDGTCMNSCMSENNLNKLYSEIPSTEKMSTQNSSQSYSSAHK